MSTETTEEARKARPWAFVAVKVKGKDDAVKVNGEALVLLLFPQNHRGLISADGKAQLLM